MKDYSIRVSYEVSDEEVYDVYCLVSPGTPGNLAGPPERCYPAEPAEVEIVRVRDEKGVERPDIQAKIEEDEKALDKIYYAALDCLDAETDDF